MTTKKCRIKKGDQVTVITGKDRGKLGEVLKVFPEEGRVIVSGVKMIRRHLKVSAGNPDGIVDRESKIHVSNVSLIDPATNKPTKVGYKLLDDGKKVRFARASGQTL